MTPFSLRVAALAVLGIFPFVPSVVAHDLQTAVRVELPYVAIETSYEGEASGSFLAVTVHAPAEGDAPVDAFQTGRTDLRGRFVFLPDRPGVWRITVDDDFGHRIHDEITLPALNATADLAKPITAHPGARSPGDKLLIGVSLLFGATGLLMAWTSRRRSPRPA